MDTIYLILFVAICLVVGLFIEFISKRLGKKFHATEDEVKEILNEGIVKRANPICDKCKDSGKYYDSELGMYVVCTCQD